MPEGEGAGGDGEGVLEGGEILGIVAQVVVVEGVLGRCEESIHLRISI